MNGHAAAELRASVGKMHAEFDELAKLLPNPLVRALAQSLARRWLTLQVQIIETMEKNNG
jgi:hypothetical protein